MRVFAFYSNKDLKSGTVDSNVDFFSAIKSCFYALVVFIFKVLLQFDTLIPLELEWTECP